MSSCDDADQGRQHANETVQQWIDRVAEVSGNSVEVLEVDEDDVRARLDSKRSVWQEIKRDRLIIHGVPLETSESVAHMADKSRTRPVSMIQVREYLAKAEELLLAASTELEAERSIAATSLAIHAGINAGDAVCGARLKERAAGQDHREAIKLLRRAGETGPR